MTASKRILTFSFSCFTLFTFAMSVHAMDSISVSEYFDMSQVPLTNAVVIKADPIEPNPHRTRWLLDRKVELTGVSTTQNDKNQFVLRASVIESHSSLLVRAADSSYFISDADYACTKTSPHSERYSTHALAKAEGEAAARFWKELLSQNASALKKNLESLRGASESMVLVQARGVLQAWLVGLEAKYRKSIDKEAKSARESFAKKLKCDHSVGQVVRREWREMIEKPAFEETPKLALLGRAPSKRFNGFYTVKLSIRFMGTTLNGRFLVDPMATSAVISSDWANKQGIDPRRLLAGAQTTLNVTHSFGKMKGPVIRPDQVSIGGVPLVLSEWILGDTFLFDEPKYPARCCDGIIGVDFLREFAVEFDPRDTTSLILYSRDSFSGRSGWSWDEIFFNSDGVSKALGEQIRTTRDQPVFVDAANGRYWYSTAAKVSRQSIDSGRPLKLEFRVDAEGGRQLIVADIKKTPVTLALIQKGLKRGDVVRAIGSHWVEELDQSQVNALIDPAKLADIVITSEHR